MIRIKIRQGKRLSKKLKQEAWILSPGEVFHIAGCDGVSIVADRENTLPVYLDLKRWT